MVQISNAYIASKADNKNVRENLMDAVFNADSEMTPALSAIGTKKIDSRTPTWTNDDFGTISNTPVEFAEDTAAGAVEKASQVKNHTQIFRKAGSVDDAMEVSDVAGNVGKVNYEIAKAAKIVKLQMEKSILGTQGSKVGSGSTAPQSAGLGAIIKTNALHGTGGATGGYNAGSGVYADQTLANAGNRRVLTEALLEESLTKLFDSAGASKDLVLFANGTNMNKIAGFSGRSNTRTELKDAEVSKYVEVYRSATGQMVKMYPSQYTPLENVYAIDASEAYFGMFRPMASKTNDSSIADGQDYVVRAEGCLILGIRKISRLKLLTLSKS